jgi:hypothetical protein
MSASEVWFLPLHTPDIDIISENTFPGEKSMYLRLTHLKRKSQGGLDMFASCATVTKINFTTFPSHQKEALAAVTPHPGLILTSLHPRPRPSLTCSASRFLCLFPTDFFYGPPIYL